jgi:hypothetical protein
MAPSCMLFSGNRFQGSTPSNKAGKKQDASCSSVAAGRPEPLNAHFSAVSKLQYVAVDDCTGLTRHYLLVDRLITHSLTPKQLHLICSINYCAGYRHLHASYPILLIKAVWTSQQPATEGGGGKSRCTKRLPLASNILEIWVNK